MYSACPGVTRCIPCSPTWQNMLCIGPLRLALRFHCKSSLMWYERDLVSHSPASDYIGHEKGCGSKTIASTRPNPMPEAPSTPNPQFRKPDTSTSTLNHITDVCRKGVDVLRLQKKVHWQWDRCSTFQRLSFEPLGPSPKCHIDELKVIGYVRDGYCTRGTLCRREWERRVKREERMAEQAAKATGGGAARRRRA